MAQETTRKLFQLFNEVGIVEQLSRTVFEARLPDGFLVSHFSVLNHLIRVKDGQTPLALALAFQVPKTTMTHTLARLEKEKLIEMKPNPDDGRSKCVWITERGMQFRDDAINALAPDLVGMASDLDLAHLDEALMFLTKLRQLMDERRP